MAWRRRGGCGRGYPLPLGVRGLDPGKFLKISFENLRFKGHVYAVLKYF
jgi:hypothetical protein